MSTEIQTEDIVDIINENYGKFTGTNEGVLHAAEDIIELFKSKKIEPDFQKVLHETVFAHMRDKPLKNRVGELDKDKMTENLENMVGNLSSPIVAPTAWKYLINGYDGIVLKVEDVAFWMEDYAKLCVEHERSLWENEIKI